MTDEQNEVKRVDWPEVFCFTHIFKSFRMAIHPSKLLLALGAIVLIWLGGTAMDSVWSLTGQRVMDGEIDAHTRMTATGFDQAKDGRDKAQLAAAARLLAATKIQRYQPTQFAKLLEEGNPLLAAAFAEKLAEKNKDNEPPDANAGEIEDNARSSDKDSADLLGEAEDVFEAQIKTIEGLCEPSFDLAKDKLNKQKVGKDEFFKTKEDKADALKALKDANARVPQLLTLLKLDFEQNARAVRGRKIFESLFEWEHGCFTNAMAAVRYGNFTGGMAQYRAILAARGIPSEKTLPAQFPDSGVKLAAAQNPGPEPVPADDTPGFLYWKFMGAHGLMWFVKEHWLYATIFMVFSLAVVSVFGGAIHRIAALQFARDEKISMGQALRFSAGKFFSFFSAPLIPLAMILLLGGLLAAGGFIANAGWGIGPVVVGLLFFLALLAGLLIAFLTVGLIGGAGLMYPTIAVEGSDSFDAMSRSFSYIFARPWHGILYAVVMLVYGVITYLFVRLFAFLTLRGVHCFAKWGVFMGGEGLDPNADKIDVLWTAPTFDNLLSLPNTNAMTNAGQWLGGWIIWIWVALVVGMVMAYVLSYAACGTTVIYCLLRRKIDATDLDDVYVEEIEEEEVAFAEEGEQATDDEPAEEAAEEADEEPAEEKPAPKKRAKKKKAAKKKPKDEE